MDKPQKCWTCANACGGCAWSASFRPIPGWTAEVRQIWFSGKGGRNIDTYAITDCPEYICDPTRKRSGKRQSSGARYDQGAVTRLVRQGLTLGQIAAELGVAYETAYRWRKKVGANGKT